MSRSSEKAGSRLGGWIAGGTLLLWALVFLFPASPFAHPTAGRVVSALAALWHLLNIYVWLTPAWRRSVIEQRGPLLGVGFAFGASVVGAVADAFVVGATAAAGSWLWRFLILAIPFLLPLVLRLPYRPHVVDLGVIALAIVLPHLPGFGLTWIFGAQSATSGGFFASGLGAGSLGGGALLFTYFCGARYWTLAPVDLKPRKGDALALIAAWALGVGGAVLGAKIFHGTSAPPLLNAPTGEWHWLLWLLAGPGLAVLVEAILFRSVLQSWIAKALSRWLRRGETVSGPTAALITAALHAAYGPFALSWEIGFFVSLALGLIYVKSKRYFPMVVAHGLILLTLALIAPGR